MFSRLSGEHAMDSGYYAAMTGLVARTQALDTAAGNLANAQTPGYRAEREYFRSTLLGSDAANSQLGRTVNNYGLLGGDRLSMAQGSLQTTGNPLDLAIEGEGFFQVQTANGLRYTRDGSFQRAQNGQLVTSAGEPVLSSAGKTIAVPPGEVSVGADRCRSGSSKKCLRSPGRHREREPGRNSGFARSDRHAAAGGDDAEGADRLPYRIQQDRD